ncbi:RNA-directed DNA polymerase, eukaryota [Tanacetum coccineum]|uniref:RNA-directed DNA polymerase, eukaryota n=1 Tax=Tanacetum coccineum TaxID=301880 RepID=A0ABQ5FQI9_9ASTR
MERGREIEREGERVGGRERERERLEGLSFELKCDLLPNYTIRSLNSFEWRKIIFGMIPSMGIHQAKAYTLRWRSSTKLGQRSGGKQPNMYRTSSDRQRVLSSDKKNMKSKHADGKLQQWFREGLVEKRVSPQDGRMVSRTGAPGGNLPLALSYYVEVDLAFKLEYLHPYLYGGFAPNGSSISDRKAYLQANMTRDNTKSVNGEIVGDRNAIQVGHWHPGHRSNNYSESKRNDHIDNNRRQEQRNKGIPNKSHPNFREEHKSFSSIFVSNIPWNASVQDLWDICNKWGVVIDVYIAAKRSKSGHRFGFVRFINVNDINQLVSNLRTAWMGGFHLFADVAKYGRTYNRPVERSGDGKPSVGSNSQSVSINENVFQSFNSYAKAVLGNKSVDMSGKYGTSNAGAESVGVSDCNKVYKEAGNEAVMSISVDDCIDLDGMERSILAKVKDLSVISELLKHMSSEGFDDVGLRYVGGRWVWLEFDSMDQVESVKTSKALKEIFLEFKDVSHDFIPDERCVWIDLVGLPLASWAPEVYKKLGGRWGSSVFTDMVSDGPMSHGKVCVLTESLHRVIESFIVSYRNRTYRIIATEFAYWAPNIESMEVNSESNPLERKDAEGPSLDESLENEEHLDVDSCDSDSPKNVNNDSVSPSSRVLREEDVRGVESDLVDSFEEGEIRDDSVLYNDGCIKDCMEKNLEDDAGEILGVHSQGDCGNVTTDDNEDVTPVIAPEKDSIIAPPSTPPGNDLNIAVHRIMMPVF